MFIESCTECAASSHSTSCVGEVTNLRIIALVVFIVLFAIPFAYGFLGAIVINIVLISDNNC